MLATQEEFLPPILIRSFYDFARRISFRDNTLYRCNVKLANCVIFFFFLENLPETNISLVWRFVFGQLSKGRYISITKNKRSYRLTFQSFNFRIIPKYILSVTTGRTTRYVSLAIVGFNGRNNRMKTKREKIAANRKNGHLALSLNEFTTSRILRSISNKGTRMAIRLFRNDVTVFCYTSRNKTVAWKIKMKKC